MIALQKKKMENHSVCGCLPGNCGQVLFKICPLLDFGQPQTSWLFTSLPSSLSLWISLACGFCSSDSPRRQLSIQYHPALYGMLSARRAMRSNSCVQPVAVEFLPYARHHFFCWGLRVGLHAFSSGRSAQSRHFLCLSCPQPLVQ